MPQGKLLFLNGREESNFHCSDAINFQRDPWVPMTDTICRKTEQYKITIHMRSEHFKHIKIRGNLNIQTRITIL